MPRRRQQVKQRGCGLLVPLLLIGVVLVALVVLGIAAIGAVVLYRMRTTPPGVLAAEVAHEKADLHDDEQAPPAPAIKEEPPPPVAPKQEPGPALPVAKPLPPVAAPKAEPPALAPAMDATIPQALLKQLKNATVFVKRDAGVASASGSGFLMHVAGEAAYLVTNHHVVTPRSTVVLVGRLRPRVVRVAPPKANITVVFRSGSPEEQSLPAEVVSSDADADLAILRVTGARDLPPPVDFSQQLELVETMPIFTFGFPFGKLLATNKGNPAITVGSGKVSALRNDEHGDLHYIQVAGDLNPGNSGGPVVDARGRLVGVVVAGKPGTQISFLIPAAEVTHLLTGRVVSGFVFKKRLAGNGADVHGDMWLLNRNHSIRSSRNMSQHLNDVAAGGADSEFEVEAKLLDPLRRIKRVTLLYARTDGHVQKQPNAQKRWDALAQAESIELRIEEQRAVGGFTLPAGARPENTFALQLALVNAEGHTVYTQPRTMSLNFNPGAVAVNTPPPGNPGPGTAKPTKEGPTQIMGGAFDPQFRDEAPDGGLLIGFRVGLGKFFNNDTIAAVQPIYRTKAGEVMGTARGTNFARMVTVKAKDGYAVGAITAKAGLGLDGFSVTFMRVSGDQLNAADTYRSDWLGGRGGGGETLLTGGGRPIVGIVGKSNAKDCTGLGLLVR